MLMTDFNKANVEQYFNEWTIRTSGTNTRNDIGVEYAFIFHMYLRAPHEFTGTLSNCIEIARTFADSVTHRSRDNRYPQSK